MMIRPLHALLLLLPLNAPGLAWAQPSSPPAQTTEPTTEQTAEQRQADRVAEMRASLGAALEASTKGPATVPLLDEATLRIPEGIVFIPPGPAARLARATGNMPASNLVGIVYPLGQQGSWWVEVEWKGGGYVRDDEQKDLNADDILEEYRAGTAEGNKDRVLRGFPEMELQGWTQPPVYDATTHRLSWALLATEKGEPAGKGSINFNTRALGRNGYFSLNLITSQQSIEKNRPVSAMLLSNLDYTEGKRYEDFNGSTDRVAEYGLAALLGVAVAKKVGFLAVAGLFLLKFAKVGVLAVVGGGLALRRIFRRKA